MDDRAAEGPDTRAIDAVTARIEREAPDLLAEHGIPGMAVGIGHRSGFSWSRGFGTTERGGGRSISRDTIFSLQSISKAYTAMTVLTYVQDGTLDLDEPIGTYLPDFDVRSRWEPEPVRRITLRRLLSHTSGLTHEAPLGGNMDDRDRSFEEHCASIRQTWLRFPVGHHYEYSNLGIDLAGLVLQRVAGLDFAEVVRRRLLEPLGLGRTTFDGAAIARDQDRAVGHAKGVERVPLRVPMVAAGGVYASVEDALGFARFHLTGGAGVVRPEVLAQAYEVPNPLPGQRFGYGLGVAIACWNGRRVLTHSGSGFGFLADLVWEPESGLAVAVLTNHEDHPLQPGFASGILRDLTGEAESPETPGPEVEPEVEPEVVRTTLAELPGQYVGRGGSTATIGVEGDGLRLKVWGASHRLRTLGAHEAVAEDDEHLRFRAVGPDGRPGRAYLVSVNDETTFYRNDPVEVEERSVRSYAVDYFGRQVATIRMRGRLGSGATLEGEGAMSFPPLSLTPYADGLAFSSMGEAVELEGQAPTYANIPLRELPEPGERAEPDGEGGRA